MFSIRTIPQNIGTFVRIRVLWIQWSPLNVLFIKNVSYFCTTAGAVNWNTRAFGKSMAHCQHLLYSFLWLEFGWSFGPPPSKLLFVRQYFLYKKNTPISKHFNFINNCIDVWSKHQYIQYGLRALDRKIVTIWKMRNPNIWLGEPILQSWVLIGCQYPALFVPF